MRNGNLNTQSCFTLFPTKVFLTFHLKIKPFNWYRRPFLTMYRRLFSGYSSGSVKMQHLPFPPFSLFSSKHPSFPHCAPFFFLLSIAESLCLTSPRENKRRSPETKLLSRKFERRPLNSRRFFFPFLSFFHRSGKKGFFKPSFPSIPSF